MLLDEYLAKKSDVERTSILEKMIQKDKGINLEFVEALIQMPISDHEKFLAIKAVKPSDGLSWELFLIDGILNWNQNISARLISIWADSTAMLFHKILMDPKHIHDLPQRVFYTLVDLVSPKIGKTFFASYLNDDWVNDFSPALAGLCMLRAVQFGHPDSALEKRATRLIEDQVASKYANSRGLLEAILYVARFKPDQLQELSAANKHEPWDTVLKSLCKQLIAGKQKVEKGYKPSDDVSQVIQNWPVLPLRHTLSTDQVGQAFATVCKSEEHANDEAFLFEFFAGIKPKVLTQALSEFLCKDVVESSTKLRLLKPLFGLFDVHAKSNIEQPEIASFLKKQKDKLLPSELLWVDETVGTSDAFKKYIAKPSFKNAAKISAKQEKRLSNPPQKFSRTHFELFPYSNEFLWTATALYSPDLAEQNQNIQTKDPFWTLLLSAIEKPDVTKLDDLTKQARQQPYLFNLLYLRALGLYKGKDEAALRLMEYVRSDQEIEIAEVLLSLSKVDTPRSLQEVIGAITRPNVSDANKLEAVRLLKSKDTSTLQSEIKSTLNDLQAKNMENEAFLEIKEILSSLLTAEPSQVQNAKNKKFETANEDLDTHLAERISVYDNLSTEVKRALRTGQFFYDQVTSPDAATNIEVSPIIDMVYKSLELHFRESFENDSISLVKNGVLQRKLDVIGYARPIPKQMDSFEDYISKFEIISDIPFFSKFKLRKMLRALCQYKPGKRFTLDGLKAFALFFLCFSRKECRHGLANLFPLGFENDRELFKFVKSLHVLQDFRNRAVHEGFRPDARNDIEGIWGSAAEIFENISDIQSHRTGKQADYQSA